MSLLLHPHDILKRYILGSIDGGIAWDESYALVFTEKGEMVVRVTRDYSQDYKTPDVREIEPADWDALLIGGESLRILVVKKLREILPTSN